MEEVTAPYFQKRAEGRSDPPRGRWHRQEVSAKPQNISAAIGQRRTRFLARMPRVLGHWEAALHRYARGGGFPRWQDDGVAPAVLEYVARLDRAEDYSNQDIRRGLDHRADSLIRAARAFIAEVVQDVGEDASRAEPPTIATLILNRAWPNDDARGRRAVGADRRAFQRPPGGREGLIHVRGSEPSREPGQPPDERLRRRASQSSGIPRAQPYVSTFVTFFGLALHFGMAAILSKRKKHA